MSGDLYSAAGTQGSVDYLEGRAALESLSLDPYWPKWDSPWWHMMLLDEMGLADRIPRAAAEAAAQSLQQHAFKIFLLPHQQPGDHRLTRTMPCHCQVATGYRVLRHAGLAVDEEMPWMRRWLTRYTLPDGGVNCDEAAHEKVAPKSSLVSTVAVVETVLWHLGSARTPAEDAFLDGAVRYLIAHRLIRSQGGDLVQPGWLKLRFPRFYKLDILRALRVVLGWARQRAASVPWSAVAEGVEKIRPGVRIEQNDLAATGSLYRQPDGTWLHREPAALYPLLEAVSQPGQESESLASEARLALEDLSWLQERGLVEH